ncbi:piggyBac transposable element-derived protein 2-like [Gordionus sp. m RMFG-2023]|uniref:piggyBac transposable element-derived protein 2-like n=1 Tax=Gordionus sp. m RMFG-2023 TaxID=3053472 RepID=UPI0031FCC6A5
MKRFLTIEQALAQLFEEEPIEERDMDIIPPNISAVSDEEDFDKNDLTNVGVLPSDTAGELEIHNSVDDDLPEPYSTRSYSRISHNLKWRKTDAIYSSSPFNGEKEDVINENDLHGKSPSDIFSLIFDEDLYSLIVEQINIYAKQMNRPNICITIQDIQRFIGILLFTGYHSLPQERLYWSNDSDISIPIIRDTMTQLQFRNLKYNIHLADKNRYT